MTRDVSQRFKVGEIGAIRRVHDDLLIIQSDEGHHVAPLTFEVESTRANAEAGGHVDKGPGGFATTALTGRERFRRSVAQDGTARRGKTVTGYVLTEVIPQGYDSGQFFSRTRPRND